MATHLEQRRRAIADALRAVMAEPLPRQRPPAAHVEHGDVEDLVDDLETPAVPPVEPAGSMSRAASMALFGHA